MSKGTWWVKTAIVKVTSTEIVNDLEVPEISCVAGETVSGVMFILVMSLWLSLLARSLGLSEI